MCKKIFVTRSSMPTLDEYVSEIKCIWDSHWLTNMGAKHRQLEAELIKYLGTDNISLFVNGHLALENTLASLNLTGEVITTPYTFASTTHAIVRNGLTPVFCDINDKDYTIDVDKIEPLITNNTSAIVPVHVYGNLCDVDAIDQIAQKYNLKVIYDAAHTFGVRKNGVSAVNFGDASILSFHATKVFNTIEGGAVCFREPRLKKILDDQKNFGFAGPESVTFAGGNAKMNEFQAAMGICNLRYIDAEIAKRKRVAERYVELLENTKGLVLQCHNSNVKHNYAYMPVVFDGYKYSRDIIFEKLRTENIFARKYFYPLTNTFECYKDRFDIGKTPVAEYISERVLTLPIYADLELKDVDRICHLILN